MIHKFNEPQEETIEQREGPMSRKERRLRRFSGLLLCEWCNKWTHLGLPHMKYDEWKEYVEDHPYIMCKRPQCIKERQDAAIGEFWNGRRIETV
jgi:hypothetical protein